MKLVIQPEVEIGAHTYQIRWWNKKMKHAADATAQSTPKYQVIRLDPDWSDTMRFEHLIHEIKHQIEYLLGEDSTERYITAGCSFLTQAMLSLGIEPDFSLITEEE